MTKYSPHLSEWFLKIKEEKYGFITELKEIMRGLKEEVVK
jgi:hypothetical protein